MKRKNLLNETQVRKFMKLANINKDVANNFLAEGLETQGGNKDRTAVKTDANIVPKGSRWLKEQEDDGGEEVLDDLPGDEAPMGDIGDTDDMGDMGDEAPMGDMGGEEAPMGDMGGEEAPAEDEEGVLEGVDMIDDEEVVTETLRRVTRRIKGMQKRDRLAETVTNRIMKRLRKNK